MQQFSRTFGGWFIFKPMSKKQFRKRTKTEIPKQVLKAFISVLVHPKLSSLDDVPAHRFA